MLKTFRIIHLYLGLFIAPALLFFALTGALQTFGLHESNRDHPDYHPAKWIVVLAQLHKKQVTALPQRRAASGGPAGQAQPPASAQAPVNASQATAATGGGKDGDHPHRRPAEDTAAGTTAGALGPVAATQGVAPPPAGRKHNPLPLRIFFLVVCIGLFISTGTGIYMSYKYKRSRLWVTVSLLAGVVVPLLLLIP